jgi:superfamily II DNA or RNA helicase
MGSPAPTIRVPARFSTELKTGRNRAVQVLVPEQDGVVHPSSDRATVVLADGARYPIAASGRGLTPDEPWVKAPQAVVRGDRQAAEGELKWMGERERDAPAVALASLEGRFRFAEASEDGAQRGLRRPQLGAVHAVLGHWTSDPEIPATVVMPTGTGKTETMLALLAAVGIHRLLVVVPSDALRSQIARKFETLGVLLSQEVIVGPVVRPVVGRIRGAFEDAEAATAFADACNVVVTTPAALFASEPAVMAALLDRFTHLFVDEAHHVPARTWRRVRDSFTNKPVLQFTATPYRADGEPLGGQQVYRFRLARAQELGYFAPIDYTSVIDFAQPDRAIAERAVHRLREDLAAGLDHVLMARVNRIGRARDITELYEEIASDLEPVVLDSSLAQRDRRAGLDALFERRSRIVVCVDMLGEGFDLPALKVAAIHDPHKSLGVTLQYVGRFARSGENIGRASVFVGRPEGDFDHRLRRLYAEEPDWNEVVSDLSENATEDEVEVSQFETGFSSVADAVPIRTLSPKMSTVVYRTACSDWRPERASRLHPEDDFATWPVPVNPERRVLWFIVTLRTPIQWADLPAMEELVHHLYVAYWDADAQLLYINSSNKASHHVDLAKALAGDSVERISGPAVYRAMHNLQRMLPTNVGLLDVRNRNRRFSMLVGADVSDGFPTAEAETKTQTNIFASGYEDGARVTIGASLKGRVWSYKVAPTIKHWVDWCNHVGAKLADESISVEQIMGKFIRPVVLQDRPDLAPLAIEWPWEMWLWSSEDTRLTFRGESSPLLDAELRITGHATTGPITFDVRGGDWAAPHEATVVDEQVVFRAVDGDVILERARGNVTTLAEYLTTRGAMILFEQDAVVVPPALLLKPARDLQPYEVAGMTILDWGGVNRRKESQGRDRDAESIQARTLAHVMALEPWDVVLDDDGAGEIADIVAMRMEGGALRVMLVHCKYTSADTAGARIGDLYEVCGQAQKSIRWRHYRPDMFQRLIRRERNRTQKHGYTGFMVGGGEALYRLQDAARLLQPEFTIAISQPGLSQSGASQSQLQLLGSTEVYVREVGSAAFEVYCDA